MNLVLTVGAFAISFILVMISIPSIIKVAHAKHLFEPFNARKVHTKIVPPMGGVAIFIGFTISSIIATDGISFDSLKYIIASVIIIFFIGLKDDLMDISARKKLMVQIFAAVILITLGNVRFTYLHGILGIKDIGFGISLVLSIFAMVVIMNAFNLIDGIDGLASGLAILAAGVFGSWFYVAGHVQFAILSFALVGSLVGFFIYNVFGHRNKLFMGDTGSLIIGLVISALVVKFNEFNVDQTLPHVTSAAPAVSFAIIIVPLIDTLRVMTIRISHKKSPFSADTNHIHHRLLQLVTSHFKVTLIIIAANAVVIAFAILLNQLSLNINFQFILVLLLGILISFFPSIVLKLKSTAKIKQTNTLKQYS